MPRLTRNQLLVLVLVVFAFWYVRREKSMRPS